MRALSPSSRIESDLGPDPAAPELPPYITESSIYIARKSAGFAPARVNVGPIRAYGRDSKAFRNPRVAPGEGSVLFSAVFSINSYVVFAHDLETGQNKDIGAAVEWCVEWGGSRNGSVLTQRRYISENGIKHRCYAWSAPGNEAALADECEYFDELASAWSHNNGGICS